MWVDKGKTSDVTSKYRPSMENSDKSPVYVGQQGTNQWYIISKCVIKENQW